MPPRRSRSASPVKRGANQRARSRSRSPSRAVAKEDPPKKEDEAPVKDQKTQKDHAVLHGIEFALPGKTLTQQQLDAYHQKCWPFRVYAPQYLICGMVSLELPTGDHKRFTVDEYSAGAANLLIASLPASLELVCHKHENMTNAYTWALKDKEDKEKDELDLQFLAGKDVVRGVVYGMHNHGGYHGMFKPDLTEVYNLLHRNAFQNPSKFKRLYVNTAPFPGCGGGEAYNVKLDMHYGKTTWVGIL